jgi:hypothetical protein
MVVQDLIDELHGYPPELEVLFLDSELDAVPVTETTVTDEGLLLH